MASVYSSVKQAMQDLIAPQLESVKGEIGALRGQVEGLRNEMGSLRNELRTEIRALDEKTTAHIMRLDERLTIALDLRERIVAIEARLRS